MRELLNKFGYAIVAALLVIAVIATIHFFFTGSNTGGNPSMRWFIDEETQEESVRSANELPPLPNKDGKRSIVMQMKYTTDNGKTVKTLYYMKYSDDALAQLNALPPDDVRRPDIMAAGEFIRAPEAKSQWLRSTDPEAGNLRILPPNATFAWPP